MLKIIRDLSLSFFLINVSLTFSSMAQVNSGLCLYSFAPPILNITFGKGDNPGQPLGTIVSGANTSYTYEACYGSPASPVPVDGYYSITNNVPNNGAWFYGAPDHTPGDVSGFMAFFNASPSPGQFYQQQINGLCGSTSYEFAAWVANALNPIKLIGVQPDITFRVETLDGILIALYNTGGIPQTSNFTWKQFGMTFSTPPNVTEVILKMINNNIGGTLDPGNDFAIDDITLRPCTPQATASFDSLDIKTSRAICSSDTLKLFGNVKSGYALPTYVWQVSTDQGETWFNLSNSNALNLKLIQSASNDSNIFEYRMLSGKGENLNSMGCNSVSNLITVTVSNPIISYLIGDSSPCNDQNPVLLTVSTAGANYVWQDGSTNRTFKVTDDGDYSVNVTNLCGSQKLIAHVAFKNCDLAVPNVFSPNNDEKNDTFYIRNLVYHPSELKVFNRWGEEVYSNKLYANDWDGHGLSDGMYYFQLTTVQDQVTYKGWVQLIRN